MRWSWLTNRFVVTFGGAALLAAVWNVYIANNDDGRITGRVVDAAGQPVEGATADAMAPTSGSPYTPSRYGPGRR